MSIPGSTAKTYGSQTSNGGDQLASAFDGAAKSAQHTADSGLDSLSEKIEDVRDQAVPAIDRITARASAGAKRGFDAVRKGSQQLRDTATRTTESTIAYVKVEPVKSVLLAAAAGALLMGLVSLIGRSRRA